MSTNARQGWNAAQRAAEREPQKPRKMHGPVGESFGREGVPEGVRYDACTDCGFHVHAPTCPTQRKQKQGLSFVLPFSPPPPAVSGQRSGKTLTLLEAAAACREHGKTVVCVESVQDQAGTSFRWCSGQQQFECQLFGTNYWGRAVFPHWIGADQYEARFEVVEEPSEAGRTFGIEEAERLVDAGKTIRTVTGAPGIQGREYWRCGDVVLGRHLDGRVFQSPFPWPINPKRGEWHFEVVS